MHKILFENIGSENFILHTRIDKVKEHDDVIYYTNVRSVHVGHEDMYTLKCHVQLGLRPRCT